MPYIASTWFLNWFIQVRTRPWDSQIGWRQRTFFFTDWCFRWTLSTLSIMYERRLNLNVFYSYESCSFPRQNIRWIFSQTIGNSWIFGGESGVTCFRANWGVRADCGLWVWNSCLEASAIIKLIARTFRVTIFWGIKSLERSQRNFCSRIRSSSWCSITGSTTFTLFSTVFRCCSSRTVSSSFYCGCERSNPFSRRCRPPSSSLSLYFWVSLQGHYTLSLFPWGPAWYTCVGAWSQHVTLGTVARGQRYLDPLRKMNPGPLRETLSERRGCNECSCGWRPRSAHHQRCYSRGRRHAH